MFSQPHVLQKYISNISGAISHEFSFSFFHRPDPKARLLMRVQLSKEKLYEAKRGIFEWYKQWDQAGIGLSPLWSGIASSYTESDFILSIAGCAQQARYEYVMMKKNNMFQQKYLTYQNHVNKYHCEYPNSPLLQLPAYD
jgi:hypothetical protein